MDTMSINVEASANSATQDQLQASAKELTGYIKGIVGVSAIVNVGEPGAIERSAGKAVRVIDKR